MPLSSHARTLADIFQRRGDVLARTEMAKHQALAQGLQGVGGALGDWLTQKQETKQQEELSAEVQEALTALGRDPNQETLGRLQVLTSPQFAAAALENTLALRKLGATPDSTPGDALELWEASGDPRAYGFAAGVASGIAGERIEAIPENEAYVRALLSSHQEEAKPEDMIRATVPGEGGEPRLTVRPESEIPPEGIELYEKPPPPPKPVAAPAPNYQRARVMAGGRLVETIFNPRTGEHLDPNTKEVLQVEGPAPTADTRNRQQAISGLIPLLSEMRTLSEGIIKRVGPLQRAEAIKRGAEAVFGTDPDFRTYADFRAALGGAIAVAVQGSRPSDADIFRVAEPMIPDPYKDTSESAKRKWALIIKMFETRLSPEMKAMLGLTEKAREPETPETAPTDDPLGIRGFIE